MKLCRMLAEKLTLHWHVCSMQEQWALRQPLGSQRLHSGWCCGWQTRRRPTGTRDYLVHSIRANNQNSTLWHLFLASCTFPNAIERCGTKIQALQSLITLQKHHNKIIHPCTPPGCPTTGHMTTPGRRLWSVFSFGGYVCGNAGNKKWPKANSGQTPCSVGQVWPEAYTQWHKE